MSWFCGKCKKCGCEIIVQDAKYSLFDPKLRSKNDYYWYCSNKQCSNHIGELTGDQEEPGWLDEEGNE